MKLVIQVFLTNLLITTFGLAQCFGSGTDGSAAITLTNTVVNSYSAISSPQVGPSPPMAGFEALNVANSSIFSAGDLVVVHQTTDPSFAGRFEFARVLCSGSACVSGSNLHLTPLRNTFLSSPFGQSAAQVIRVPQYENLTISSGASIVCPTWDSSISRAGGVIAFAVSNVFVLKGKVDADGKGMRGGSGGGTVGQQGDSPFGPGSFLNSANFTAGGGGETNDTHPNPNRRDGSGGGGAGLQAGGAQGIPHNTGIGGAAGMGIGPGGHSRLMLGSGGGGGSADVETFDGGYGAPGSGGRGGGCVLFVARKFLGFGGDLTARGFDGQDGPSTQSENGGGGGGSGGTIVCKIGDIRGTLDLDVSGGQGGLGGGDGNRISKGGVGGDGDGAVITTRPYSPGIPVVWRPDVHSAIWP